VYRVAIVWRGDKDAPDALQPETSRLKAIFAALGRRGMRPEPAPYDEAHADAFGRRLRELDAVLVWVNPLDAGRSRKALDDILREVASAGVYVSAHPDVIAKMGVKAVLHRTRTMGWGTDTRYYETLAAFEAEFPKVVAGDRDGSCARSVPTQYRGAPDREVLVTRTAGPRNRQRAPILGGLHHQYVRI
jgi:hypothetical protein